MAKTFAEKRNFSRSPEPHGDRRASHKSPIFVIQQHDASTLHYDFRIEVNGVLKSWAVPKGPSTDPRDRRLALRTEDHPLEYAEFEGVIPEGEYGGGAVLVWDKGVYENATVRGGWTAPVEEALEAGHVLLCLHGQKIQGGYALQRTESGEDEKWLLIKMDDDKADARRNPTSTEPKSVLSQRTLKQVAREESSEKRGQE